jgi:cyclophilin family peptidyl-prolyl cis-trans isomerase
MSRPFLDVAIGEGESKRLVFEMFDTIAPRACQNFRSLCQSEYIGSRFHRVIDEFMIQGGDYINGDGTGGKSIYGEMFEDEEDGLARKHDEACLLSMANKGPNSNHCWINLKPMDRNSLSPLNRCHISMGNMLCLVDWLLDRNTFVL